MSATMTITATATTAGKKQRKKNAELTRKASSRWRSPVVYAPTHNPDAVRKMSHKTKVKRQAKFLQEGRGTIGIRVRRTRAKAWTRKLMCENLDSLSDLLPGAEVDNAFGDNPTGHWSIRKSFIPPIQASLDALIRTIMDQAHSYAQKRHRHREEEEQQPQEAAEGGEEGEKKARKRKHKEPGLQLLKSDLETAIQWYRRNKKE